MKEVKSTMKNGDELFVLLVAGLTDVLIKSVEEGKSELNTHVCPKDEMR